MNQLSPYSFFRILLDVLVIVGLYVLGVLHWCYFFDWGEARFVAYDWPKEFAYLDMQRHVLVSGDIPWHVSRSFHGSDRFLAMPETNLLPQVLLLPWLDNRTFLIVNTVVLYSASFLGCLWARARYGLGLAPFAFLVLLVNFNGYITAHLSVGHCMWGGYFFLPFFALFLMEWTEQGPSLNLSLRIALLLFAMMLQGSFHLVNWCWLFLLLFVLLRPDWWWQGLLVFFFSGLLNVCRIVPAALAFWGTHEYSFTSGYPTATDLLAALVVLRDHKHDFLGNFIKLGWYEYDAYIGLIAFGALAYLGVWLRVRPDPELEAYRYEALDAPLLAQTFLSIGPIYAAVAELPIPLVNAERVSSRFIVVPLVVLIFLAAVRLQRLLQRVRMSTGLAVLLIGLLVETGVALGWHSWRWRLSGHDKDPFILFNPIELQIVDQPDAVYVATVVGSAAVSALVLAAVLVLLWRSWRRA